MDSIYHVQQRFLRAEGYEMESLKRVEDSKVEKSE